MQMAELFNITNLSPTTFGIASANGYQHSLLPAEIDWSAVEYVNVRRVCDRFWVEAGFFDESEAVIFRVRSHGEAIRKARALAEEHEVPVRIAGDFDFEGAVA